jgi:hypothetical protein
VPPWPCSLPWPGRSAHRIKVLTLPLHSLTPGDRVEAGNLVTGPQIGRALCSGEVRRRGCAWRRRPGRRPKWDTRNSRSKYRRSRLEVGIPLRHPGWVPLDRDRVARVRSECIKSTPSDRDPTPLIAYRFAARWSNLDRSDLIGRPRVHRTPSRVSFAKETLCFYIINPPYTA